ncbi:MAG TPA: SRPBCC family protein [Gemmatimonadaceae bacterium]|nr:SRPBCC family protein [Gemmatimonadaceae bacterium]
MRRPLRITLIVVGSLVGLVALSYVVGLFMPRDHVATSEITLRHPVDSVYAVLRNFSDMPKWWKDISVSERVANAPGERWRQKASGMEMQLDVVSETPPLQFVTKIVEDQGLPFGGIWTYSLSPTANGTVITVTEKGWVGPPPFRVMSRIMGHNATLDGLLTSLAAHFGESVTPVHK